MATNSIRGGANRGVLDQVRQHCVIYEAWDDEAWVVDGAAVRVSLVCFAAVSDPIIRIAHLDGQAVDEIFSDLTARHGASGVDLTKAPAPSSRTLKSPSWATPREERSISSAILLGHG